MADERSGPRVVPTFEPTDQPARWGDQFFVSFEHRITELDLPKLIVEPLDKPLLGARMDTVQALLDLAIDAHPLARSVGGWCRPRMPAEESDRA